MMPSINKIFDYAMDRRKNHHDYTSVNTDYICYCNLLKMISVHTPSVISFNIDVADNMIFFIVELILYRDDERIIGLYQDMIYYIQKIEKLLNSDNINI